MSYEITFKLITMAIYGEGTLRLSSDVFFILAQGVYVPIGSQMINLFHQTEVWSDLKRLLQFKVNC